MKRGLETVPEIVSRTFALVALFFTLLFFLPAVPAISGRGPGVSPERPTSSLWAGEGKRDAQRTEASPHKTPPAARRADHPVDDDGVASLHGVPGEARTAVDSPRHAFFVAWSHRPSGPSARALRARPQNPRAPPAFA